MVVDASVWVSRLVQTDTNHPTSRAWMERYIAAGELIVDPTLVLAEVAGAISRRSGTASLGRQALSDLLRLRRLLLLRLDADLAALAAQVASDLKLHGSDAVYVAVAQRLGIPLVTWDREQRKRTASAIVTHTPDQMN